MEAPDPPTPPPNKGGFKGKRSKKRSLSRNQKKGSKNQKQKVTSYEEPFSVDSTVDSTAAEFTASEQSTGNFPLQRDTTKFNHATKSEYANMLESCQRQLESALAENAKKDKIIQNQNKRIQLLIDLTKSARGDATEAKQHTKKVVDDSILVKKRLEMELVEAEEKMLKNEMAWKVLVDQKVDNVLKQEQDRHARAVSVEQKRMRSQLRKKESEFLKKELEFYTALQEKDNHIQSQLQKQESEFKSILKNKDKHIQIVTNIASTNRTETAEMHAQTIELKQAAKNALDQKDVVHTQARASQTKVSSTMLQQKNAVIRELKCIEHIKRSNTITRTALIHLVSHNCYLLICDNSTASSFLISHIKTILEAN